MMKMQPHSILISSKNKQEFSIYRYCAVLLRQCAYLIIMVVKDGKYQMDENATEELKFKMNLLRMLLLPLAL